MQNAQPQTNAARDAGQKNVSITFVDGETIIEKNVDEIHEREEELFLRRYGCAGLSIDRCDVQSWEVVP